MPPTPFQSAATSDERRLKALRALDILDTAPEDRFDRITRLAARLFGVPVALVTLVDADRQWFKSRVGVPFAQTPVALSFCAHAIGLEGQMVVRDTLADPRFADNPLVTGIDGVRFYAGHPVAAPDGTVIGTLCVLDRAVRDFGGEDRAQLADLAAMVANEIAAGAVHQANERCRRSEAALRALLDHLPDGVLLLDDAGTVVAVNPAAELLFGQDANALTRQSGASLLGIAHGSLAPLDDTGARRHDATIARADGSILAVEAACSALDIDGRRHLVASLRDMSEHHAAASQRRAFFRKATHELRTPMSSILGFSELLLKREFDAPTNRELLEIIHKQTARLVALTNQMLDLARIEGGGPDELLRTDVTLRVLVADTIAATVPPERAGDVTVLEAGSVAPVQGNAPRLQQALSNILANALQFSDPGSPVGIEISPAERAGRPGASVEISDRGIGMGPDIQARIFDAFYRAGDKPGLEGAGLGMLLVREILAFHGGCIEVASRPGAGTSVTAWLPAAEAAR